jgi:hypothetical protein
MFDSGVELPSVGSTALAGLIEQNHAELMARECRMLQLACAWADAHYLDSRSDEYQPLIQRACAWGGEGTPEVSEYCVAELGALQGTIVAKAAAGDVIWFLATVNRIAEILAARGDTDPIGARRARAIGILAQPAEALQLLIEHQHDPTEPADPDGASEQEPAPDPEPEPEPKWEPEPDVEPGDHHSLSMALPPSFDASAAKPRVVHHFHLSEAALRAGHAVVRPEACGPLTLDELVEFLGRSRCQVRIQPVLDPTAVAPIDGYEVPQRLRAAVRARQIADVFPFGTCLSPKMDLDHTERYVPTDYGGPPSQTRLGDLGPMARPNHRAVTHGGWAKHQPEPGYFVHRSPVGYVYLVTNQGTLALGRTNFSAAVWQASTPKPAAIPA